MPVSRFFQRKTFCIFMHFQTLFWWRSQSAQLTIWKCPFDVLKEALWRAHLGPLTASKRLFDKITLFLRVVNKNNKLKPCYFEKQKEKCLNSLQSLFWIFMHLNLSFCIFIHISAPLVHHFWELFSSVFVNFISCLLPFVSFVYVPVIVAALSLPFLSIKTYCLCGFSLFFSTTTSVIFLLFMS